MHIKITSIFDYPNSSCLPRFSAFLEAIPKGRGQIIRFGRKLTKENIYAAKTLNLHAWARWLVQKEASNEPVAAPPTDKSSQWECMTTKEHGTTNVQWAKFHHLQLCADSLKIFHSTEQIKWSWQTHAYEWRKEFKKQHWTHTLQ